MKIILLNIIVTITTCFLLTPVYSTELDSILEKALSSDHRSLKNRERDKFRNPKETLKFFGLTSKTTVMEISPGKGWYTEVIAPIVNEKGTFYSVIYKVNNDSKPFFKKMDKFYRTKLKDRPDIYENVNLITISPKSPKSALNGKIDMVLTFRNVHNWAKAKSAESMFSFFYDSLKREGILGVVEHRAKKGTPLQTQIQSGYMTEKYVIELAQKVGFKYISSSTINNNPKDKKNHARGVWNLLPNLRGVKENEKEKYYGIGESDRMTLKFKKP